MKDVLEIQCSATMPKSAQKIPNQRKKAQKNSTPKKMCEGTGHQENKSQSL